MTKKSLNDALVAASPSPLLVAATSAVEVVDDLDRILALPRRPVLDCALHEYVGEDKVTRKKYSPEAEALIRLMTTRLGRGKRLSCACRPRIVRALGGGVIQVTRIMPEDVPPEPPLTTTVTLFAADNQANAEEISAAQQVSRLKVREELRLPAADGEDGHFCIDTLNAIQAWALYEIPLEAGGIGFASVGAGKCLGRGTEIFDLREGRRRFVEEEGSVAVPSFDGTALVREEGKAFTSGRKYCYQLRLADGSEIVLSFDHRVYTHRGWVEAKDLTNGDFVAVPTKIPDPVKFTDATDDEVSLVALMLADGGCTNGTPTFTNETPDVINEFKRLAVSLCRGFSENAVRSKTHTFKLLGAYGERATGPQNGTGFRDKWELFGLSKEKRVKSTIWGLPSRQVALFLNRFWACDGHVSKKELECTLASEKLIDDLRFLLLRVGVRSRKKFKLSKCNEKTFDSWRILISGKDAQTFLDVVGDVLGKEKACQNLREMLRATKRNTNFDVVPISRKELIEICGELGIPKIAGRRRKGQLVRPRPRTELMRGFFQATDGQFVSREKFVQFCLDYEYKGKYVHLGVSDLGWERVVSLVPVGEQDVFDLSVPKTQNFVANNMVVHNSIIFILMPMALGDECETAVLFIEPNQRQHYVSQYKRIRCHFRVPSIIFEDGTKPFIVPDVTTLHLLPYSKLGNPKHPDELDNLNPNVLLADEAHRLTGKVNSTGRTRVRRYITKKILEREARMREGLTVHRRAVYLVPMSGTLEDKSVEDTQPVAAHALGMNSPLPLDEAVAQKWTQVFDPVRSPDRKSTTALRLQRAFTGRTWGADDLDGMMDTEGPEKEIREGYQKRRTETPGVISASASEVGASLYFRERKAPKMPEVVAAALKKVREEGIRPDGEIIVGDNENNVEAMVKIVSKQVACGLYLIWIFPKVPCTCQGVEPRCEGCKLIEEWYNRRKKFGRELRPRLLDPLPHLDSPKLCKNAAIRAEEDTSAPSGFEVYCINCREAWPCGKTTHLPAWRSTHWKLWGEIENKVPHEQRVRWVGSDLPEAKDDATHPGYFLARDAVKYAHEKPSVLWFSTVGFAQKVAQLAKLPYHGGGPDSEALIRAETGKRSIIASIKAHGKGLDHLQNHFDTQLIAEMMSSNRVMEQLLGRLLRRGQKSDRIITHYYAHVLEFREALRRVKQRAEFNQTMQGNRALILAADFDEE